MGEEYVFVGGGGDEQNTAQNLLLRMANRHGMIAGATGTGKTVTLQILAEGFSDAGVPVFVQDVKGDLSGLARAGTPEEDLDAALRARADRIGMKDFGYRGYPVVFWDLFGSEGHPVRTTVTEMGPLLLSRLLDLSDAQEGVLNIAFRVADEQGLALLDLKDLQAMLVWLGQNAQSIDLTYGNVSNSSVGAIQRELLILENQGATGFLGEPHLDLQDLLATDSEGRGLVHVLMADRLMHAPRLYSMFLLWLLSELFEAMPEVGDPDKPAMVFFFDEAHLLFDDAPKALVEKVVQVVRLIRSKGVGVFFITQNPDDIPSDVLAQLGNRLQHALRAYTPRDQKALRAAAETFRPNPAFDTETAIREVGTGEAVVSLLLEKGVPSMVERTLIRPPRSRMGPISDVERRERMAASPVAGRYDTALDRESAQEILARRAEEAVEKAALEDELLEASGGQGPHPAPSSGSGYTSKPKNTKRLPSLGEELARTALKQLNTRQGQRLVRGVLGSLFRGR